MSADMLDLFHRTTPEAAAEIVRTGSMVSREWDGSVYFSTVREGGQADGYGSAVVHVRIPSALAVLDDEFPGGEQHYRVLTRDMRPGWIVGYLQEEGQ